MRAVEYQGRAGIGQQLRGLRIGRGEMPADAPGCGIDQERHVADERRAGRDGDRQAKRMCHHETIGIGIIESRKWSGCT